MRRISRARPVGRFWCPRCVLWFVCRKWFAIRNQTFFQPARPFVQLILAHCQDSAHCQSAGGLDFICKPFLVRQGCAETQRHLLEKIYIQSVKVWQILEICGYITVMYGHIPKNWWLVDCVGCRVSIRSRGIFTKGSKQQCVGVHPGAELKEVVEDEIVEPFVRWKHFADIQQSCTIECKYKLSVRKKYLLVTRFIHWKFILIFILASLGHNSLCVVLTSFPQSAWPPGILNSWSFTHGSRLLREPVGAHDPDAFCSAIMAGDVVVMENFYDFCWERFCYT